MILFYAVHGHMAHAHVLIKPDFSFSILFFVEKQVTDRLINLNISCVRNNKYDM